MRLSILLLLFVLAPAAGAQNVIRGHVSDADTRGPIPGVNVVVVGTPFGAATDIDGQFRIVLPDSMRGPATVRLSFVGFQTARTEIALPRERSLRFIMRPQPILSSELVASGSAREIVVTGTRTARDLETVAIPTEVVGAKEIAEQGATRLSDVLSEQPGITGTFGLGSGIQVQGFDPDYTLILIDGEPIIGRTRGTLDLERIGVSGVERVEIVKGPSSSLYGSDALAGVVNIITRRPEGLRGSLASRLETNATRQHVIEGEASTRTRLGDVGARLTLDRYTSDGYDNAPEDRFGPTVPAFTDHSARLRLRLGRRFDLAARIAEERQRYDNDLLLGDVWTPHATRQTRTDWSLAPRLRLTLSPGLTLTTRAYLADYRTRLTADDRATDVRAEDTRFAQRLAKADVQLDRARSARHFTSLGAGGQREAVEADRITGGRRVTPGWFAFAQHEWMPSRRLSVVASARYDAPGDYQHSLSPKLAVQGQPMSLAGEPVRLRAAFGTGFKAPTFQARYLDFTNPLAGYTVVGAVDAADVLRDLDALGQIAQFYVDPSTLTLLEPERSRSLNASADLPLGGLVGNPLDLRIGAFAHHIRDLIEFAPVALKTNGQEAFTYQNIQRARTRGVEATLEWRPTEAVRVTGSYQYLRTADLDQLERIDAGRVFSRDAQNRERRLTRADYGGLLNRSRHSGTLRLSADIARTASTISVRAVYRSRYGYRDVNGNDVLDDDAEYVRGHVLWNATLTQPLPRGLRLQLGAKNVLDYRDPARIPGLPGRLLFVGLRLEV